MENKMTSREVLKGCPFCGGEGVLRTKHYTFNSRVDEDYYHKYGITCDGDCNILCGDYEDKSEAIAAWNTRASEAALLDEVLEEFKLVSNKYLLNAEGLVEILKEIIQKLKEQKKDG